MKIYIRNLNTGKGAWIKLDPLKDFEALDKAIEGISKGDDWEMTDTDNSSGVNSDLIRSPKDALAVSMLMKDGIQKQAINLVADYNGGIDCSTKDDVEEFAEKCHTVRHAKDKEDFVLERMEEEEKKIPDFLHGYVDTDKYFQDHYDFNLDGRWSEDSDGVWVYFA